jgi:Tfp pilus assembly protein PilF
MRRADAAILVVAAVAISGCGDSTPPAPAPTAPSPAPATTTSAPPADERSIRLLNRGVGEMGQFEFEKAEATFRELLALRPGDPDVRRNRAIAELNQTSDGAQDRALDEFRALMKARPDDVRSAYVAGLAALFLGRYEDALPYFEAAAAARPEDAYAAYYVGLCREYAGRREDALLPYRRATELDPYLRSAQLRLQQTLDNLGRADEAAKALAAFEALDGNPRARLAEFKYTRMGALSEVVVPAWAAPAAGPEPEPPFFEAIPVSVDRGAAATWKWNAEGPASLAVADLDADGQLDVVAVGALERGTTAVFLGDGAADDVPARVRLVPDHPLADVRDARAVLLGDIDNDGRVDAYICRDGENRLFLQTAPATWSDVTAASGAGGGPRSTVDGALADLDHDGDLDLYLVHGDGPCDLLANRSDGTFLSIGESSGARGDGRPATQVVVADLDADRDADLALVHAEPPHEILLNDRLWRFTPADAGAFGRSQVDAAIAVDRDVDGRTELLATRADGTVVPFVPAVVDGSPTWKAYAPWELGAIDRARGGGVAALDVRGNGELALVLRQATGFASVGNDGRPFDDTPNPPVGTTIRAWTPMVRGGDGPSILVLSDEGFGLLAPTASRGNFVTFDLRGRVDPSQAMRSNAGGIGARVRVRRDDVWTSVDGVRPTSGPGQSLQPTAIGVGGRSGADFVSVEWSDGVMQTELGVAAGAPTTIVETQRQISSCPVIFAWNGERFEFVTDCLGVGGIGYLVGVSTSAGGRLAPEYAPPRPWERVLLPATLKLEPLDGALELRLGEPMEEALYLDAARLVAYDVPPGFGVTVDERMAIADPQPSGDVVAVARSIPLARALADGATDVTASLVAHDHVAADPGDVDPRFIGLLRSPRSLTLEFAEPIGGAGHRLVAHGWVEYPYCQTNFAAWQAGRAYVAPDLEARGADGTWTRVLGPWGYPAGMPREMSLPLDLVPQGSTAIRLTSTQEIYWDSFAVAVDAPEARLVAHPLRLVGASAAEIGFPERVPQPQKRPDYHYLTRSPFWSTRHQDGLYSAFGSVYALLAATDDAVAVIGPGEEIRVRFASPPPVPEGWTRRYVLEADGWCKDMDLFTGDGETVGPLPMRDASPPPASPTTPARDALHRASHTRWRSGH